MTSIYILCFAQILLCALSNRECTCELNSALSKRECTCELNSLFLPRCPSSAGTRTSHIKYTYRSVPLLVVAKETEAFLQNFFCLVRTCLMDD